MSPDDTPLDPARCLYLTIHYMQAQGWRLVPPGELAAQIWADLKNQGLSGKDAVKKVENQVWQHYAAILHDCCRRPDDESYEQAWSELSTWLLYQTRYLKPPAYEPEVILQEALAYLHKYLSEKPLGAPRAFLAFTLKVLINKNIDQIRYETAIKRPEKNVVDSEKLGESGDTDPEGILNVKNPDKRGLETVVSNKELHDQLLKFFRRVLSTSYQQQIAEAHFLDGLSPKEIASLIGKRPHEIRMVKARIVDTLRSLPREDIEWLLNILGKGLDPGKEGNDE